MTNPPDRVWVTMDRDKFPRAVNDSLADAKRDEDDLNQFNRSPRFGGPYTTHEYRLHRPINWHTGVPDAETRRQCKSLFALLLPDGSVLRECVPQHDGDWWWGGAGAGEKFIDPEYMDMRWCPEDEMPEGARDARATGLRCGRASIHRRTPPVR